LTWTGTFLCSAPATTSRQDRKWRSSLTGTADGFYEWRKEGKRKAPMRIRLKTGEPFGFAGLWDSWRKPDGNELQSFTIITTEANELLKPIHDRMPVILPEEAEQKWLSVDVKDASELLSLLKPYPSDLMEAYDVSLLVNSPRNDLPECIRAEPH